MSVRRLLAETDSRELGEWMAFESIEGLPDRRNDFGFGQVCATLANVYRKEDAKPFGPDAFMPWLRPEAEPGESVDEDGALLLNDPEAQSRLLMRALFGSGDG